MRRILIIDDNASVRLTTQDLLEILAGWKTWVAASGEEGLVIAQREQPDVILLDLMMPDMDGITTLHHLRVNLVTRTIPVILFTAVPHLSAQQQQRLAKLPVTGIIHKPFEPSELVEKICFLLNWNVKC